MRRHDFPDAVQNLCRRGPVHEHQVYRVTVTTTKREKSLKDVLISVSVISGEKIEQTGIAEFEDLAPQMPKVHIAEASIGTNLFIRGNGGVVRSLVGHGASLDARRGWPEPDE